MTPNEVAALYRVAVPTVKRWAREGKVPARKVRGLWRFERAEVLAEIERTGVQP
jgi:excisionase family DNA binding protein